MLKKKTIAIILVLMITCLQSIALADSCPLPKTNTDAKIVFSGFDWYTDYKTTVAFASAKGIENQFDWSRDNFEIDKFLTPHWHTVYNSINSFAGSEQGCGGYLFFTSDLPNVAGYRVDDLSLYLMWNPEMGVSTDITTKGALQFYMAKYTFDVTDKAAAYKDLVSKLKKKYGDNPYTDTYGLVSSTEYTVWVNEEQALVAVSYDEYSLVLVYMAPGAEEKLIEVEEMVKKHEIDAAADDMSGL